MQTANERVIPEELARFFESGLSAIMVTRGADLVPTSVRVWGLAVAGDHVTLLLPQQAFARIRPHLEGNGEVAVSLSKPSTHQTYQIKGRYLGWRDSEAADMAQVAQQRASLEREIEGAGVARVVLENRPTPPCLAVMLEVRDVFVQTPGPGAGERL